MDELIRKHDGHRTRLTLNRPQKANALSAALVEALPDAVDYAQGDGTRLLVLGARRLAHRIGADYARSILSQSRTFGTDEALGIKEHIRLYRENA